MKIDVAIIDDEKHACETLKWQLEELDIACTVIGVFQDAREALPVLKKTVPTLIFLDIEMPGLNGFQFLEKLNNPDVNIVFTTAYDKFAVDAFRVNAVDFLIKPIDIQELENAIERVIANDTSKDRAMLARLFSQLERSNSGRIKIGIPSVHGIDFVDCREIIYCQSESNYTRIYLADGRKILASKTLKGMSKMLPENLFFRLHNSYIVNLEKIKSYSHEDGGLVILDNDHKIKVSRTKKKELLELLASF